ncbi:MAG: ABC transporter ATP-binding protein [Pseudomonadota bacterium]
MAPVLSIRDLRKTYDSGFVALKGVSLDVEAGEIFALLGPNGAGKTTLISIVCGIVMPTSGSATVDGFDIIEDFRETRRRIGLVPQELTTDAFESVWNTVSFSRGLFGMAPDPAHIEKTLRQLSLWDKRDERIMALSGGMKRRVLIAKALSHEPQVLFLDEPTAGVDVELRQSMWDVVRGLADAGVTVVLTTHYLEEAEEMSDRVGVIQAGELMLVEQTAELMQKMGRKELVLQLSEPISALPPALAAYDLTLGEDGCEIVYSYDTRSERTGITGLLAALRDAGVGFRDLRTSQSSLEEIFVDLVREGRGETARDPAGDAPATERDAQTTGQPA